MNEHDPTCRCCVPLPGLTFFPWRGENYEVSPLGVKVLVMGESTYDPYTTQPGRFEREYETVGPSWFAHQNLLRCVSEEKWPDSFASKWIGLFLQRPPQNREDRLLVVDSIAFWNYADEMLPRHGKPPGKEALKGANSKLKMVLAELQPNLVVFLSTTLWTNLVNGPDRFDCETTELYESCALNENSTAVLHFPHPRGFYWKNETVRPKFKAAVERMGGTIPLDWQSATR